MMDKDVLKWKQMLNELYTADNPDGKMHSAIADVAQEMGVSKILLTIEKQQGENLDFKLYTSESHHATDCRETFQYSFGKDEDVYLFQVYVSPEKSFSKTELQMLEFLTQILFIIISAAQARKNKKESELRDWKTGIGNLNYLFQKGQVIINEGKIEQYAAVHFNIKNFKLLNEMFGAEACDQVLIEYSHSLQTLLQGDEILIRLGGDGFVALIEKIHLQEFLGTIKDYPVSIYQNNEKMEQRIGVRVGIYLPDSSIKNVAQIMNYVTMALSNARSGGGEDGIVYYSDNLSSQLNLQNHLKNVLEFNFDEGELVAYFQPKVNLDNNQIVGAEALVRWQHNDRILYPDEFIPMAERNGLVCQIDYEILRQTCENIAKWQAEQIDVVPISVNFSKRHLMNKSTAKMIYDIVAKYQINPALIEIEFTETAFHNDQKIFRDTVDELKYYGFRTSVDDFGAGSSNLNLLQNLMFDVLKIDKSFLDDSENNKRNQIILSNLVQMAEALSMAVICEGVETKEHAEFLKSIHCNCVQGFLFDKPLTPEEFRKKLIMKKYE